MFHVLPRFILGYSIFLLNPTTNHSNSTGFKPKFLEDSSFHFCTFHYSYDITIISIISIKANVKETTTEFPNWNFIAVSFILAFTGIIDTCKDGTTTLTFELPPTMYLSSLNFWIWSESLISLSCFHQRLSEIPKILTNCVNYRELVFLNVKHM